MGPALLSMFDSDASTQLDFITEYQSTQNPQRTLIVKCLKTDGQGSILVKLLNYSVAMSPSNNDNSDSVCSQSVRSTISTVAR